MVQIRKKYQYAAACLTSMGVRITPEDRMPVHNSTRYYLQSTSAETDVLNVLTSLGMPCLAMTKFVKGSPIARFIRDDLRRRNFCYEGKEVEQDGPWGCRHQFNILDSGYGLRAPRMWNDRAGEVGRTLSVSDFDLERIFEEEGVGILHLSGLIASLSEETTNCCVLLAEYARQHGTLVSFDLNYRASFWQGREKELRSAFTRVAALSDILLGNEEDFQLCLGIEGPAPGGKNLTEQAQNFQRMIENAKKAYPNTSVFATTLRQVISANEHLWGAILTDGEKWYYEQPRKIDVLDRNGGGDGFAGGVLYGISRQWPAEKWIQFGWASAVLAACSLHDYAEPLDEKQVWDIYLGNARVQR